MHRFGIRTVSANKGSTLEWVDAADPTDLRSGLRAGGITRVIREARDTTDDLETVGEPFAVADLTLDQYAWLTENVKDERRGLRVVR